MFSTNLHCLGCQTCFEDNAELRLHLATHQRFVCKQCGISTADYDLFLNHSLTFCRSNLLGKSCYYCTSLGEECQCLVVAKDIFGKVREVAKEAQAKELYSSDFFTTMLQYHCNAQFQLEQTDEFQFIMALQTNAQRTQFTLDNMPKFQIQGRKIACILWEMNEKYQR